MRKKISVVFLLIFLSGLLFGLNQANSKKLPEQKISFQNGKDRTGIVPGQIRVKFKKQAGGFHVESGAPVAGIYSVDEKIIKHNIQTIEKSFIYKPFAENSKAADISKIYTFHFPKDKDAKKVAQSFANDPNVEYAEPVPIHYIEVEPNDPLYNQQDHLPQINMPEAWDVAKGDSNVIIAIVDGGTDWEHPDLIENIWTNEAEEKGVPGVDDDGNGFVDDIHGWDFADNDNEPTNQPTHLEAYYHGTVTAGLASARTNNNSHVAGVAWNCQIMPLKHGRDDVERAIYNSGNGMIYAAENGAHIINASFGGFYQPSQAEQDVIDYVYSLGVLVVASAGNELVPDPHYPSGYPHVLSVTWVYSNDVITGYSTYGDAVDVTAPGVNLLSLLPGNGTIRMDGSSSATPVVSGLAGLIKSQHPEWGPMEIMRQIVLTADNIDHLNPGYEGQLGSGRVNGYRAVTETDPAEIAPKIRQHGFVAFSDSLGGDNDGIFERGEIVDVEIPLYRNFSVSPAENLVFNMTTNDTDLTIIDGSYNYGYFPPDTTVSVSINFSFSVNENAKGKTSEIYIGWQADGGTSYLDTFKVIIGKIPILIVDDDQGAYPAEVMYTSILDSMKLNYAIWDRSDNGPLAPDQLANFPIVVWICEWAFPTLDPDDQLAISNFLDNGGSLFISGQDIGWDFNDPSGYGYEQRDFYTNYLHAVYHADTSPISDVIGIPGDPIGDGLQFNVYQPGLPAENQYPDEIEPDSGATSVFEYVGGAHHKFGVKYKGDHKVVYLAMGLEAIDAEEFTSPDEFSPARSNVMKRTISWLNFIDHVPPMDTENLTQAMTITAKIPSRVSEDLVGMELHWKRENDIEFNNVALTDLGNHEFSAEIPGPGEITTIEYYLKMINSYYEWQDPPAYPDEIYSYYVGPDPNPPTFSHAGLASTINGQEPRRVFVGVLDDSGVDTAGVYLHFSTKTVTDSVKLSPGESSEQFQGNLPKFSYGDTVHYYFSAYDLSSLANRGQSETFSYLVGFEDFEHGLDSWDVGTNSWGKDNLYAFSGDYSINDSPGQNPYPNNRNVSITTAFSIDLSNTDNAVLKLWTKVYLELNHDYGYIEVSSDGGSTWNLLGDVFNGFVTDWQQQILSLSDYCGPGFTDVKIRSRMVSDATQAPPLPGWFIDDMQIIEGVSVPTQAETYTETLPEKFALHQNYPNPFNPKTTIHFDLPETANINVSIFNIRGELIRTLVDGDLSAGIHTIQWNGKDNAGQATASGVYFYRLTSGDFSSTRKLLFLK